MNRKSYDRKIRLTKRLVIASEWRNLTGQKNGRPDKENKARGHEYQWIYEIINDFV